MGYMTLANFRTDVDSALGSKGIDNTRLDRWINFGYHDLGGSVDFESLETNTSTNTVSSTQTIAVPSLAEIVKLVKDTTNDKLLGWIPKAELFRRAITPTATPTNWTRHGDLIYFTPVPNAIIAMFIVYKIAPTRLTSSGAVTVFADIWDPAVFLLSVHHGLLALGQEARSASWLGRAISYIGSRITEVDMHATASGLGTSLPSGLQALQQRLAGLQNQGGS